MDTEIKEHLISMSEGTRLSEMFDTIQHGDTECLVHTVAVVCCALAIAKRFGIRIDKSSLVRGGILHDYFLYDWHDGKPQRMIHGFTHPSEALRQAEMDFELNDIERDIIKKHMFPLTVIPPRYREGWLICMADKICAIKEATPFGNDYSTIRKTVKCCIN